MSLSHSVEEERIEDFQVFQDQLGELIKDSENFSDVCYKISLFDKNNLYKLRFLGERLMKRIDYIDKYVR